MAEFTPRQKGVQVNGMTVLAVVDGFGMFEEKALAILTRHGLSDVKPDGWYSQEAWLNAFKEISATVGANVLYQIGRAIPRNAVFPPAVNTVEKALHAIDQAYHMNHRNGDIGHYRVAAAGAGTATLVCDNPYPCAFDRGIIQEMAAKFAPKATVQHDDTKPCRHKGADSCTYDVKW